MFTAKIDSLKDFNDYVGFWSGAKDRWDDMTDEEKDYLDDIADGMEFESLTQVNDFIWFDSDELLEEFHANDEKEDSTESSKESEIRVLVIHDGECEERLIKNELATFQGIVGGYIECFYPIPHDIDFICDEEGKFKNYKPSMYLMNDNEPYDIVMGNIIVCGHDDEGNFASLTDEQFKTIGKELERGEHIAIF